MGGFNKIQFCLKHGHIPQIVLYIIPNLHVVFIIPQNFHDMRKRRMPPRIRRFFFFVTWGKEQKTALPAREGLLRLLDDYLLHDRADGRVNRQVCTG